MPKILLTNAYDSSVVNVVKDSLPDRFSFETLDSLTKEELIRKAPEADYFLASGRLSIDKTVLDAASRLKMIQRTGVGTDSLDIEELKSRGIPVYVNKGINADSVAEHTIMLILASLRRLVYLNDQTKKGFWNKQKEGVQNFDLNNKTVALIGLGSIGKEVVKRLTPFGAKIIYYDQKRLPKQIEKDLSVEYMHLDNLLKTADIISLHCPYTENNHHFINSHTMDKMKTSAVIVNTARGKLIDQGELIRRLKLGTIKMAALDVFEEEPLPKTNDLSQLENVILSPHVAGITHDSFQKMFKEAFNNIVLFENQDFEALRNKRLL